LIAGTLLATPFPVFVPLAPADASHSIACGELSALELQALRKLRVQLSISVFAALRSQVGQANASPTLSTVYDSKLVQLLTS